MSVTLKFHDKTTQLDWIEVNADIVENDLIFKFFESENQLCSIFLDKSTAIKLSKELRKQIALID